MAQYWQYLGSKRTVLRRHVAKRNKREPKQTKMSDTKEQIPDTLKEQTQPSVPPEQMESTQRPKSEESHVPSEKRSLIEEPMLGPSANVETERLVRPRTLTEKGLGYQKET